MNNINAEKLYDKLNLSHLNIGCGEDISISQLAKLISKVVDFNGLIEYDSSNSWNTKKIIRC